MKITSFIILLGVALFSSSFEGDFIIVPAETGASARIETFTFLSNGTPTKGKIYLPASYEASKNLPAIFLIDYTEQHFKLATDEFERVIEAVGKLEGVDALVVALENIPDVNAEPGTFKDHYELFTDMASYVDGKYTSNPSRTLIGKGSESGIVLMTLILENSESPVFENFIATDPSIPYTTAIIKMLEEKDFPQNKLNKKLHFSFSTSNDREKCTRLIDLINKAQFSWLEFESKEYTETNYENTYPISFADGIKYVFSE